MPYNAPDTEQGQESFALLHLPQVEAYRLHCGPDPSNHGTGGTDDKGGGCPDCRRAQVVALTYLAEHVGPMPNLN